MIPLLTRAEARAIDLRASQELGLPSVVLMENAGAGAARVLRASFGPQAARALCVGGPGQNGGDAWVVARHLHLAGLRPVAALVGREEAVRGDAAVNLAALGRLGVEVHVVAPGAPELEALLEGATCVVDGLFGTGLDRPLDGGYAATVRTFAASGLPLLALDVPSGVDADTGAVLGVAARATVTATFAGLKRGLFQHPGASFAGRVELVSIGVGAGSAPAGAFLLEPGDAAALLPRRAPDAHKGASGHVVVVAGSPGKTGAALLAGLGALRAGAGLVTLLARRDARDALDRRVLELMLADLPDEPAAAVDAACELARAARAAVVGPGLGTDELGRALSVGLAERLPIPAVLDADALTALADAGLERLSAAPAARVLTPHPGEAARLLGDSVSVVQRDRYGAARELARRSGHCVLLKGAGSVIAGPEGPLRVVGLSVPALAVAGTGDVLAGVVAALMACCEPSGAACGGALLHAMAGELLAESDRGLLAGELAAAIPAALERCRAWTPPAA